MKRMILNRRERLGLKDVIHLINFKLLAIVFALLFVLAPVAWGQEIEWIRQFGGIGPAEDLAEAVDANGNVYIAGKTDGSLPDQTSAGDTDAFVRKYDSGGNLVWTCQFGTEFIDYAYGIAVDAAGVYVAGYTDGTLQDQTSEGGRDAFVRKYDSDGNLVWTRQFGTASDDYAYGISVAPTEETGGVYLAGKTGIGSGEDAFVCKYDFDGNELWTRQFGTTSSDQARGISVDATGGVYVAGYTNGTLGQTPKGGYDAFARKYDSNGTEVWTRQFGTASSDYAFGISVYATGVYVAGFTYSGYDAFVYKYDLNGNELWTRQFGTAASDYAYGISVDATGVYVAGNTYGTFPGQISAGGSDAFVRKYELNGTEGWTRQFGTAASDYASGITVDPTGVYVAGYTDGTLPDQTSAGKNDAFLRKYNFSGGELWTCQFGSVGTSVDVYTCVTADGYVYIAGKTDGTLPGQTSNGGSDAFVSKYDPNGTEKWTLQFGTASNDYAQGISVDDEGVYVAGYTYGTFLGQTRAGGYDVFVRKYDLNGTEVWTRQFGTTSSDQAYGISIDGTGVYVAGYTYGTIGQTRAGGYDVFVRKYDLNGNEVWTRQFGSTSNDYAHGISVDDEGVYVTGFTYGTIPGQTSDGGTDAFVRKYDLNGNEVWTRQFGTTSYDYAYGISNDAEGVYVTGYTIGTFPGQINAGYSDAFVRKYDLSGTEVWTRQFGTASSDNAIGTTVDATGVYVAGYTGGALPGQTSAGDMDAFVRKYNTLSGTELWTYQFGTSSYDQASGIAIDATGLYVSGYTNGTFPGQTSSGDYDAFVAKLMLNQPPVVEAGGPFNVDEGGSVLVTASGSDPDNDPITFAWDLDNDGNFETPGQSVIFSAVGLDGPSSQTIVVKVTDSGGLFATAQTTVEVLNIAPAVDAKPDQTTDEGVTVSLSPATFSDNGMLDTHTALIDWDDGTANESGTVDQAANTVSGSHVYADNGIYTVTVTVTDDDGATGSDTFVLTVNNVAPVVDAGVDQTVDEGTTVGLVETAFNDKGTGDTHVATIDWGDGTPIEAGTVTEAPFGPPGSTAGADGTVSGSHVYADNGLYMVTVTVSDDDGASGSDIFVVTVNNVAPTVNAGPDQLANEGATVSLAPGTFTNGSGDEHTATIDWGDGTLVPGTVDQTGNTVSGSHVYADNGIYTVIVTVTDDDGGIGSGTFEVTVNNVAPTVDAGPNQTVNEGETVNLDPATFSDPGFDLATAETQEDFTATVNWGDGTVEAGVVDETVGSPGVLTIGTVSGSHVYADNGTYTVTVTVTDDDGATTSDVFVVTVNNVAPTVGAITSQLDPVEVTTKIDASADFTDPGTLDTHTANWDWGDNGTSPGIVTEADGSGSVTGSHTYTSAGVYTVKLIVTDDDGGMDESVFQFVVVYDPSAGYVTGAGWIDSPEGAYTPEPSFTGKAKFGFVSKYKKGQSTPDGKTRFNFKTADLKFQSTSYDWLVIAGPHAKYKGSGTINSSGDYGFMVTAIDGQLKGGGGIDKFRIKIWDKATDEVVYDNRLGEPDDGDAADAIVAGSIVIHEGAGLPKVDNFAEDIEPEAKPKQFSLFQNYPNPFNPETMISFQIPQASHVMVRIFNTLGVEIRKVVNGRYEAGNYSVIWDGRDNSGKPVASGTYIYQIQAGQFVDIKKMVLIR